VVIFFGDEILELFLVKFQSLYFGPFEDYEELY